MSFAVKAIKGLIEFVDDSVDFVVDDIADPIFDTVVDVIEDDPVKAIAQLATMYFIPGSAAWVMPMIEAADVAQNGGDINDVVEAAAKVYVAQQISPKVGSYVGTAAADATSSVLAGEIIGKGVTSATHGIILGQDPVEAFILGGAGSAVEAGLGSIDGYAELPKSAQAVVSTGLAASITGREVTPELITNAILRSQITTKLVTDYTSKYTDLDESTIAILTDSINSTATAAITGGNMTNEAIKAVAKQGINQFKLTIDKLKDKGTTTNIKDSYDKMQVTATSIKSTEQTRDSNITAHNALVNEINPRFDERDRLYQVMEDARVNDNRDPTVDTRTALNNAVTAYNEYATQLNEDYFNNYQPRITNLKSKIDGANLNLESLKAAYTEEESNLFNESGELDEAMAPIYNTAEKVFTLGMDEDFNPDEYASLNNLNEDEDPYYHWLTVGKNNGLHTNNASYKKEYDQKQFNILQNSLGLAGLDVTNLTPAQIKNGLSIIETQTDGKIENLDNINTEELGTDLGLNFLEETLGDFGTRFETLKEIKQAIGEVASYVNPVSTANASQADIASGAAVMSLTDDGKLEYRPLDPFAQWDNASGQKVSKEFIRPSLNTDGYYTVKDTEGNVLDNITIDSYENFVSKGGYDGNASVGAYATYQQSLGFDMMDPHKDTSVGFLAMLDPTKTYVQSEDGSYSIIEAPEGSNILPNALPDNSMQAIAEDIALQAEIAKSGSPDDVAVVKDTGDSFLDSYLDKIDEQGKTFYGEDDTKFMAGDQGGSGSELKDNFLDDYLDKIDEQGEDFYGEDDTKFMAGDQGGPGSELGELQPDVVKDQISKTEKEKPKQMVPQIPRQMGTLDQLGVLLQPGIMQPVSEEEEEVKMAELPYDFSSIFRSPEQEARYIRPYDTNDELLKLIKGGN